jgi:hypothetical protein
MQKNLQKIHFNIVNSTFIEIVFRKLFKIAPCFIQGAVFYFSLFSTVYSNTLYANKTYFLKNDLSVSLTSSYGEFSIRDTTKYEFSRIEEKASKYYITRKLFGLFIQDNGRTRQDSIFSSQKATDKYKQFSNRTIRSISISTLSPFGTSVFDSSLKPSTRIEKTANKFHSKTLDLTIKNSLLVDVGEKVSPHLLVESEDLIRNLPYINDINIIISPSTSDTTYADILVFVKDKWTIGTEIKVNSSKSGSLELFDKNIAGTGVETSGQLYYDHNSNEYGHSLKVISRNPLGYGIITGAGIRKGLGYNSTNASIEKSFATIKANWAGGVEFNRNAEPYLLKLTDSLTTVSFRKWNGWLGFSFIVKSYSSSPAQLALSFSQVSTSYYQRPTASASNNYLFHNGNIYLTGVTLSSHQIYRDNHVYKYGSTEDIPNGFMLRTVFGLERYEYSSRPYLAVELSGAKSTDFGYFNSTFKTGGFYGEGSIEQGVIKFENSYFTQIFWHSNWFFRFFTDINYTKGFNRKLGEGEYLFLKGNSIVHRPSDVTGRERLNVKTQLVAFSPLFFYGFKFALFNFTDCIALNTSKGLFNREGFAFGIGGGIRIRNDNLVFQTFQIQLGYYPIFPKGQQFINYDIGNTSVGSLGDFRPKKPSVIDFD